MDFRTVASPLSIREVTDSIISGTPLFIPGHPTKFEGLFSRAEFWKCVARGKREGADRPRASLTPHRVPLPFEETVVRRAIRSRNTVCVSHMDRASDVLRRLCLDAESALGFPGSACVHCYYSPPGTGYDFFHVDGGAAVTLQIEGTKTWRYAPRAALPWCTRSGGYRAGNRLEWFGDADWQPDPNDVPSPEEQGYVERTLQPGDVLVIPPGVWHSASASNTESLSLNLRLTAAPSIEEILQVVRHACLSDSSWRQPFPFASDEELRDGTAADATVDKMKALLRRTAARLHELADDDFGVSLLWFRSFLGTQDSVRPTEGVSVSNDDTLTVPEFVRPRIAVSLDGRVSILAQGKILHIKGGQVADVLKEILQRRRFRVSEIRTWSSAKALHGDTVLQLVQKLVNAGFLLSRPTRPVDIGQDAVSSISDGESPGSPA